MQMFRTRSWRVRSDAAEARARKAENNQDLHAIRAALFHGEEVPQDALSRLNERERRLKIARGEIVEAMADAADAETNPDEAKRPGGRPRKG